MSSRELSKKEAIELITPVVDNEVDEDTRIAFFRFIEENPAVRQQYESIRRIKEVVSNRCPCTRAPLHLKKRMRHLLSGTSVRDTWGTGRDEDPVYDLPVPHRIHSGSPDSEVIPSGSSRPALFKVVALFLIFALLGVIYFGGEPASEAYNIEEYVNLHFEENGGEMVPPTISTASFAAAELELAETFDISMTVPVLENARFLGVVYTDFIENFKAPMLEYHLPSVDQYVYIFAFKIGDLNSIDLLQRSSEAIESCIDADDYHIRDINGRHIVSWRWNDIWYTAVSNHNGETLASLIGQLQPD